MLSVEEQQVLEVRLLRLVGVRPVPMLTPKPRAVQAAASYPPASASRSHLLASHIA